MGRIDDIDLHCDSSLLIFRRVVINLSNMTPNEHSESKRNVYDTCDPHYLRQLREAAGIDVVALAKTACLSVAQVRQLETDDSDSLFYSDAIKRQAYKRLLMILGAEPPAVEVPQELKDAGKVAQAHLDTLDQIVAMSEQPSMNRSGKHVMSDGLEALKSHKQAIGALLLLVVAVVLFVLSEPANNSVEATVASSQPKASVVLADAVATAASASTAVQASVTATVASISLPAVVASAPVIEIATPVASVALAAPAVVPHKLGACAYSNDVMPQLTSLLAKKETRYVYLVSTTNTELCVVDANKQATLVQLKAGENRSVYGPAPWQISGAQLQKTQIFFQGARVSVPDSITHQFKLTEVSLSR